MFSTILLMARRRALRDLPLIVVWTALVTLAVLIAVAAPRFITATTDAGAREAVARVGDQADLVAALDVGANRSDREPTAPPGELGDIADDIYDGLPAGILETYDSTTWGVIGPHSEVELTDDLSLDVTIGMLVDPKALTVIDGTLPTDDAADPSRPLPVAVPESAAEAAGLNVGDVLSVPTNELDDKSDIPIEVIAIVAAVNANDPMWTDLPDVFRSYGGEVPEGRNGTVIRVVPLATPSVVEAISGSYLEPFRGVIRYHLDPAKFTGDLVTQVSEEQHDLDANSVALTGSIAYQVGITSTFDDALEPFAAQERAAIAQFSMIVAGLLGVMAAVLVLMSRLLVLRRLPEFALERARGSSVAGVVLRTVPQAVLTVGIAVVVGLLAGPVESPEFLIVIAVIALLADPVQSLIAVLGTRTARRAPANRGDRAAIVRRGRARRVALEVTLLAIGVAALVSLLGRGLLQSVTAGIDPLLAATPVLVAAMVTVFVVRLYPLPVRAVARLAVRAPGIHGLIGSVRARRAIAVLPLLALTLSIGLTTTNAFLSETVSVGQQSASWERVGADARIDAPITDAQYDALESGADAVSSFAQVPSSRIEFGSTVGIATMLAIDDGFASVLDGLPHPVDTAPLDKLTSSGEIPVLLDPAQAERATKDTIVLTIGQQNITLRIVGTFEAPLRGFSRGPFLVVPLDALNAQLDDPIVADTTLVLGAGTDAAIAGTDIAPDDVLTRSGWLADQRALALVSGVQTAVGYSTLLVAALAIIAMLATVVAGTRDRARTLSLLRTLGAPPRFGWWIALSDLAPLVAGGLVGGIAAGSVIAGLLFRTMGLTALTGGAANPAVSVGASSVALIVLGAIALVLVSILVEVVMHRRDRLNEVLRVGETV